MPLSAITGLAAAKTNLPLVQEFLLFAVIAAFFLIAAFLIHKKLCADYSPIRDKKFHVLFGTLFSVFFGEFVPAGFALGGYLIGMFFAYGVFNSVYAYAYSRFDWRKVLASTLVAGVLVENGMMSAPLQGSTLTWVFLLGVPFFATKIWENRLSENGSGLKTSFSMKKLFSAALVTVFGFLIGFLLTSSNPSPPVFFSIPLILLVIFVLESKWLAPICLFLLYLPVNQLVSPNGSPVFTVLAAAVLFLLRFFAARKQFDELDSFLFGKKVQEAKAVQKPKTRQKKATTRK